MIVDTKKATRRWPFPNVWWSWGELSYCINFLFLFVFYFLILIRVPICVPIIVCYPQKIRLVDIARTYKKLKTLTEII